MSDTAINIRVLFWHLKVTFDNKWSVNLNYARIEKYKLESIIFPIAIYDFNPSKIRVGK